MARQQQPDGKDLATRLKSTIERRIHKTRTAEQAARERQERLTAAIAVLMDTLETFGRAVGYFQVSRRRDRVTLQYDGHVLVFEAAPDGVRVSGDNLGPESPYGAPTIEHQDLLDKWILSRMDRWKKLQQVPLFDAGLAELMLVVFGIEVESE